MEDGLLSLKWNNHKTTFFHILADLRKKQTYTDATIACEGKFFPVHKLVMSTCSDYFSEIFDKTPCKAPVVVLKDIRHHDLEALLDYMYLGEVDVKQNELAGLIKAAECLRIKGLAVPDEDPSVPKKTTHVPERHSTPPPKRRRRGSGVDESHYSHKSSRTHSPISSRSHSSVPSQSVSADSHSQVPSMPYSSASHEPDVVAVDMIKVEVEDEATEISQDQSHLLDHSSADDPGDDDMDDPGSVDDLRDKKAQLTNNFGDFGDASRDIEKEEHDHVESYSDSDQLPGPSGVQGGSMMQWGEEEGSFPQNLFGNEDPSQQQVHSMMENNALLKISIGGNLTEIRKIYVQDNRGFKVGRYICPYCNKSFRATESLRYHIRVHTGEKPFSCEYCSFRCRNRPNLKDHIMRQHLSSNKTVNHDQPHRLPPKNTHLKVSVGDDVVEVHKIQVQDAGGIWVTKFACPFCGKNFNRMETVRYHIRIHTGEKPFSCTYCNFKCRSRPNLKDHLFRKHVNNVGLNPM